MAFRNLGPSVDTVLLNNNALKWLREELFVSLTSLKVLALHGNPWVCDCKLKNFRDWTVSKKLYSRPTQCAEPSRLAEKMWDQVRLRFYVVIKLSTKVFYRDLQFSCNSG